MTATKFIITAAALSTLFVGGAADTSINSIVASSTKGFFGVNDASVRAGWNIATSIRGGSTGEFTHEHHIQKEHFDLVSFFLMHFFSFCNYRGSKEEEEKEVIFRI
jgi:hypothetical protein